MTADIFVAQSSPDDARVGPLRTITVMSSDPETAIKIFTTGMKLTMSEWYIPQGEQKARQDAYFGFNPDDFWKACRFFRNDDGANVQIRLISVGDRLPQNRPAIDGAYIGGLSIGFPMMETETHEDRLAELGFPSVVGVKKLEFSSPSGETYVSEEVHIPGPENIYVLGVKRPEIFVPVGPINPADKIGAPAYSAQCVMDSAATLDFYQNVLGYEIRRDISLEVGEKSGLKLPQGSDERFIQAFAPGANTGYLVFLDHGDITKAARPDDAVGPPSRGITMWSFETTDIESVRVQALAHNTTILHDVAEIDSPFIGVIKTLVLKDPGGYPLEIYQR